MSTEFKDGTGNKVGGHAIVLRANEGKFCVPVGRLK